MDTKKFTKTLITKLETVFSSEQVIKEWDVGKESGDAFDRQKYYTPKVDIAVGPFNIDQKWKFNNKKINSFVNRYKKNFLSWLYKISHLRDYEDISYGKFLKMLNENPRCFLAIEIENTKDPKRSLGDIINASSMGKIGIVIPLGNDKYEMFIKVKKYFYYLKRVGKTRDNFRNILIIEGSKLIDSFPKNRDVSEFSKL